MAGSSPSRTHRMITLGRGRLGLGEAAHAPAGEYSWGGRETGELAGAPAGEIRSKLAVVSWLGLAAARDWWLVVRSLWAEVETPR